MTLQRFTTKVLKIKHNTQDIIELKLSTPENFEFKAGQYVTLKIKHKGTEKRKAYSILNPPKEKGYIKLCIKIMGKPSSSNIFKEIKEEDEFEAMGPLGQFTFDKDTEIKEHYFLATGTGVVPLYSILKEFVPKLKEHKFTLLFGVKTKKDQFLTEELEDIKKNNTNFEFIPVLSREKWNGKTGHVQEFLPKNLKNKDFYICGLKELVIETEELLKTKGVPTERIKKERYS